MGVLLDLGANRPERVPTGPECVVSMVECLLGAAGLGFPVTVEVRQREDSFSIPCLRRGIFRFPLQRLEIGIANYRSEVAPVGLLCLSIWAFLDHAELGVVALDEGLLDEHALADAFGDIEGGFTQFVQRQRAICQLGDAQRLLETDSNLVPAPAEEGAFFRHDEGEYFLSLMER